VSIIMQFMDRLDAGRQLALAVQALHLPEPLVVLGLPRGGIPVAAQMAVALNAPLEVLPVRKIGAPWHPEVAVAAVASVSPGQWDVVREADAPPLDDPPFCQQIQARCAELAQQHARHRLGRPSVPLSGRSVLVVDDGIATGTTMRAALLAVRRLNPRCTVVAAPVGSPETIMALAGETDHIVCPAQPADFQAVGQYYLDFRQTSDLEVAALLDAANGCADPAG